MPSSSSQQPGLREGSAGIQVGCQRPREKSHLTPDRAGGAYDTVPEVNMLLSLFAFSEKFYPVLFDEAGTHIHNLCYRVEVS